jgi:hypothetical protein
MGQVPGLEAVMSWVQDKGQKTPESVAIETLGTKLAVRVDDYLKQLEAISASQERQAERAFSAARAAARATGFSAVCAVILAVVGVVSLLPGERKATTYAHCQMVVLTTTNPSASLLSVCMRAAGYRDTCASSEGVLPECFVPGSLSLWARDVTAGWLTR